VLASFVRLEDDLDFGDEPYHGQDGPIPIQRVSAEQWSEIAKAFRDDALEFGHSWCPDVNAPDAAGVYPGPLTARGGVRVSTNDAYLEAARARSNLTVLGNVLVDNVRIEHSRATGVHTVTPDGPVFFEGGEILLAAGAIHSPAILMRSGVGPPDVLAPLGIAVLSDLPGVGDNLGDHPIVCLKLHLAAGVTEPTGRLPYACGLRGSSGAGDGHDLGFFPVYAPTSAMQGEIWAAFLAPRSRGRVRLRSPDPNTDPSIALRLLSDPQDLPPLREAVLHVLELVRHPRLATLTDGQPVVDPDGRRVTPEAIDDRWLTGHCDAYLHAVGTCRMGLPDDRRSVVDPAGRVLGVDGLRVVDASVMPTPPRAPTHLATVMIAEHIIANMTRVSS